MSATEQSTELAAISLRLETAFEHIYRERMSDIPVINEKISIHAIGFQPWEQSYLGVMVTPWFMNLMLLPSALENWDDKKTGTHTSYYFPSGRYQFLTGFEAEIGKYQSCSLFSPMFEFADDTAAIETAEIILQELMNSENIEQGDIQTEEIEKIWQGEIEKPTEKQDLTTEQTHAPPTSKINTPISRRQLISLGMGDKKRAE